MSGTSHAVTSSFLQQCAAVTAVGDGSVRWWSTTLWPRVSESGAWSFGVASGVTMSAAVLAELKGAVAEGDGSYTDANDTRRVLNLDAGACEPSGPPPP